MCNTVSNSKQHRTNIVDSQRVSPHAFPSPKRAGPRALLWPDPPLPTGAPTTAHAQSVAGTTITTAHTSKTTTAAAAHSLYLPLVQHGGNVKRTSGIHMGNRGIGTDWPEEIFTMITGTATSNGLLLWSCKVHNSTTLLLRQPHLAA